MYPRVGLIVLNWNGRRLLEDCLGSIRAQTYPNVRTIVVDNGSTDGSAEFVRERFPETRVLRRDRNEGFAAPNNAGARLALDEGARYVAFVNNDVVLMPDALEHLVAAGEADSGAGGLCPVQYYRDRPEQVMVAGGAVDLKRGTNLMNKSVPAGGVYETQFLSGAFLMAKAEALRKTGLFDEDYYFFFEDSDLSLRLLRAGYKNLCVPRAKVLHHVGGSRRDERFGQYHGARARVILVRKNASGPQKLYFAAFWLRNVLFGDVAALLRAGAAEEARALLRGAWDGLRGGFDTRFASPSPRA